MSSWFSQISSTVSNVTGLGATVENVRTVADTIKDGQAYTPLDDHDLDWTLASGSSTENQVFYVTTRSGGFAFVQLIHSNISLWNPTVSFTCRFYDPTSNTNVFKTINMSSTFQLSPDKRSVKTDFFSITLDDQQQRFKINITHPELVVSLDFDRVDRGFKVGEGKTYLGNNNAGFVSHKFWPRAHAKGTFIVNKAVHEIEGDGMFIHAIQGMQPHLIASHWNFVNFHSDRVSLGTMRFQTTKQYGAAHVNQGSLVLDGRLLMVSVENGIELLDLVKDDETEYDVPKKVKLSWKGKTIEDNKEVSVVMTVKVKNLVDKIDVLTEIPYVIRKLVQTFVVKPYIYQWLDKATAEIKIGDDPVILSEGYCFQELVFVSSF